MRHLRATVLVLACTAFAAGAGAQGNTPSAGGPPGGGAPSAMGQMGGQMGGQIGGQMGAMPMQHQMGGMQHQMDGMQNHTGGMQNQMPGAQHQMGDMMAHGPGRRAGVPTEPGQAAFGAIQEIVTMLRADPATDWSKVDVDALRQHLIDMDEVTLRADARKEPIENGLRIVVTGTGRTLEAIQRMLPAHAQDIDGLNGWVVRAKPIADGEELTVTSANQADVQQIRALGFMGVMALGTHQMHHLAMARGGMMHAH